MIRTIRVIPDPILRQQARKVHKQSKDYIKRVSKDLIDTVKDHKGLGLAAPQIGVPLKMMAVDLKPPTGAYAVFINPEITWKSDDFDMEVEGCLSIPAYRAEIPRHLIINVKWDGGHRQYQGKVARVIQHEYDHLLGILIVDYI